MNAACGQVRYHIPESRNNVCNMRTQRKPAILIPMWMRKLNLNTDPLMALWRRGTAPKATVLVGFGNVISYECEVDYEMKNVIEQEKSAV